MPETVSSELQSERRRLTQTLHCYMPKNTKRRVTEQVYEHAPAFRYAGGYILIAPSIIILKYGELRVQISYSVLREKSLYFLINTTGLLSN
jgi:hypothetical protein